MSTASASNTKPLSAGAPEDKPYKINQDDIDELFEAAGRGDISKVVVLVQKLGLRWYSYDIERLTEQSKWYGPLETNGDALMSLLQSHKGGKLEINEHMRKFLQEAKAQFTAANKPIPSNINDAINNLLLGKDLSEEDARRLYAWCLEAKQLVVPSDYRADIVSTQLKTLQQKYEEELLRGSKMAQAFIGR